MNLSGKNIIVTGASSGVGAELARKLSEREIGVLHLFGRSEDRLSAVAESTCCTANVETWVGDLADSDFVEQSVEQIVERYGTIDVLVSNAGAGYFGAFEDLDRQIDLQMFEANILGMQNILRAVVPLMKQQGGGHILVTASDVAKRPISGGVTYCATKYYQEGLLASLRKELRPAGIKVSAIYTGLVATAFHANLSEESKDWLKASDVADSIVFMLEVPAHAVIDELMLHPVSQEY